LPTDIFFVEKFSLNFFFAQSIFTSFNMILFGPEKKFATFRVSHPAIADAPENVVNILNSLYFENSVAQEISSLIIVSILNKFFIGNNL